jgi:hypothetical protein
MKFNMALIVIGLAAFAAGLYRIAPLSLERKALTGFLIQTVPLGVAFLAVIIWTRAVGGGAAMERGFIGTLRITSGYLPTMLFLFPVMAFGAVLAGHYQADIDRMLAGAWGYVGTLFAAFVVPTSNAVAGPIKACWDNPSSRPLLLYFLTSAALVCWPIFFCRTIGLSWDIGLQMYKANWVVAIAIMPGFWMWGRSIAHGGWVNAAVSLIRTG